jgi:leucyl/phenylalanyl-tRNA--protein transferase
MSSLLWLDPYNDEQPFPSAERALDDPQGLLAVGGSLSPARLLSAYRQGIFPWYAAEQPILWWSPDPRMVLYPERIKISRSLRKTLRKNIFRVTMDTSFDDVITRCAEPRSSETGTWLTPEMMTAYCRLSRLGYAHSVEVWHDASVVGGLYGVAIGRVFFGESMFSRTTDASKIALVALARQLQRWKFAVIDCQMHTAHLSSMGADPLCRSAFLKLVRQFCAVGGPTHSKWRADEDLFEDLCMPADKG